MSWFKKATIPLTLAIGVIAAWEGKENFAYRDVVGVWTICYGSTSGVTAGMHKTDQECIDLLTKEAKHYADAVDRLVKPEMTPEVHAAFTSMAYNVGIGNFSKSTALKLLNRGEFKAACNELPKWVYAGGRKIRGLVNRRAAERELCLKGA